MIKYLFYSNFVLGKSKNVQADKSEKEIRKASLFWLAFNGAL